MVVIRHSRIAIHHLTPIPDLKPVSSISTPGFFGRANQNTGI
jgi:hypothetical protein